MEGSFIIIKVFLACFSEPAWDLPACSKYSSKSTDKDLEKKQKETEKN